MMRPVRRNVTCPLPCLPMGMNPTDFHYKKGDNVMAKVKFNPVLEQIRGQVGDLVFKHYGDEVIVGRKPD